MPILPGSFQDLWVSAHSKIVIAAPYSDVLPLSIVTEIFGMRKCFCQTIHLLKDAIGVILLLFLNFPHEELIVIKMRIEGFKTGS